MRGKSIRIERIINRNTRNTVIVPMDHGVTVGPITGLTNMGNTVDMVAEGGADAVLDIWVCLYMDIEVPAGISA